MTFRKQTFLLTIALIILSLSVSIGQTRNLPGSITKPTQTDNQVKSPLITWDYYNDFQDTTSINDMQVSNEDGNEDNSLITTGLGLNFQTSVWLVLHYTGDANYWVGSNSMFDTLEAADRWLISPMIIVGSYSSLSWKAQSVQISTVATVENYDIYISKSGGDSPADFIGAPVHSVLGENSTWTQHTLNLDSLSGDTIYIAFRHTSLNQVILALDEIKGGFIHDPANGMLGDFEDAEAFATDLSPFITYDLDSSVTYVFEGVEFAGSGQPSSFLAFNPAETTPAITGIDIWEGDQFGACFAAVAPPFGNAPNNDWIITPQCTIKENGSFSFYAKSFSHLWGLERFKVGISTTDSNPEHFTIISTGSYVEADTAWTKYEYDLSAYANQLVYVGINCVSDTSFVFCIDDIQIDSIGSIGISEELISHVEIYPNPASNYIYINRIENSSLSLLDLTGRELIYIPNASYKNKLNISSLGSGIYLVQLRKGHQQKTYKIVKN
ncbi:MAG: T9SS type A sorting domain-containing protein [Bacteroidales bacterium]|nr:T9SS type A sorting domain-containing protein [Bacteroidales bacterium]